MKTLLLLLPIFFSPTSSSPVDERSVCGDYVEGACDLSEYNIVDHNRYTDTPEQCQVVTITAMFSPFLLLNLNSPGALPSKPTVLLVHPLLHPVLPFG